MRLFYSSLFLLLTAPVILSAGTWQIGGGVSAVGSVQKTDRAARIDPNSRINLFSFDQSFSKTGFGGGFHASGFWTLENFFVGGLLEGGYAPLKNLGKDVKNIPGSGYNPLGFKSQLSSNFKAAFSGVAGFSGDKYALWGFSPFARVGIAVRSFKHTYTEVRNDQDHWTKKVSTMKFAPTFGVGLKRSDARISWGPFYTYTRYGGFCVRFNDPDDMLIEQKVKKVQEHVFGLQLSYRLR